jgi:hypothetical protein
MDSISKQILRSDHFIGKSVVGGLLIYSLLGIPFFIGYLARYLRQIKDSGGDYTLPAWNHWLALLMESWELLLVILAYGCVPFLIAIGFSSAVDGALGALWTLAWIPVSVVACFAPAAVSLAYYRFMETDNIRSAFDIKFIINALSRVTLLILPNILLFWGALVIGFPILGIAVAIALIFFFPAVFWSLDSHS